MVFVACLNCVERVPLGEPGILLLAIDDGAVLLEIFRGLGAIAGFGGICGGGCSERLGTEYKGFLRPRTAGIILAAASPKIS